MLRCASLSERFPTDTESLPGTCTMNTTEFQVMQSVLFFFNIYI